MTLEKHIIDTMKEWQIKIGSFGSDIRLYYPKASICRHLNVSEEMENEALCRYAEEYFAEKAPFLGRVSVSARRDRFCVTVGREGCHYVETVVPKPEFLMQFLEVLKSQDMQKIQVCFEDYAAAQGTHICIEVEEGGRETAISFVDEAIEPYVYCIDENEFGITYHRFTKEEFVDL